MNVNILLVLFLGLVLLSGCVGPDGDGYECSDGTIVDEASQCPSDDGDDGNDDNITIEDGCLYGNPACEENFDCIENECIKKQGCTYGNPVCEGSDYDCIENECVLKEGCMYGNPTCEENFDCIENECVLKEGCLYGNLACIYGETCYENECHTSCNKYDGCDDSKYKCVEEGYCELRTYCTISDDCISGEICTGGSCVGSTDCTIGYCEDDYFNLNSITLKRQNGEIQIKTTIKSNTKKKGKFRILCVEKITHKEYTGVEYQQYSESFLFNAKIELLEYGTDYCAIENVFEPYGYYLIEQNYFFFIFISSNILVRLPQNLFSKYLSK